MQINSRFRRELLNHIDIPSWSILLFLTLCFNFLLPPTFFLLLYASFLSFLFLFIVFSFFLFCTGIQCKPTRFFPSQKMLIIPTASNTHKTCRLPFHYFFSITNEALLTAFQKISDVVYTLE